MDLALRLPPSVQSVREYSAKDIITGLGFDTNLELCLDAGDYASYPGSGQSWLDTSGNGYDFFRGADGNASTDDPTFVGTAGGLSSGEYFTGDANEPFFRLAQANPAWVNAIHKAGGVGTFAFMYYTNGDDDGGLIGTNDDSSGNVGFNIKHNLSDSVVNFKVSHGAGYVVDVETAVGSVPTSGWHGIMVSYDLAAGAGGILIAIDGAVTAHNPSGETPSASDAAYTLEVGANGNGDDALIATTRIAHCMGWSRALTAAELGVLFNATRRRFGV